VSISISCLPRLFENKGYEEIVGYHLKATKGLVRNKGLIINGLIAFFYLYVVPDGTFSPFTFNLILT